MLDPRLTLDMDALLATPRSVNGDRREPTSVYIIQSATYCKVGIANDVKRRLSMFAAGNPHELVLRGSYRFQSRMYALLAERTSHRVLAEWSIGREWFAVDPELAKNAVTHVVAGVRQVVKRWHREDAQVEREHWRRMKSDPEYRQARLDAYEQTVRRNKDAVDEYRAVEEYRRYYQLGLDTTLLNPALKQSESDT